MPPTRSSCLYRLWFAEITDIADNYVFIKWSVFDLCKKRYVVKAPLETDRICNETAPYYHIYK